MPFDFLRRKKSPAADAGARPAGTSTAKGAAAAPDKPRPGTVIRFDGLTEEWRLVGQMHVDGRLSDALNRRETLPISGVSWAPIDGSAPFTEVPGLKSVDPYDLIVVFAGDGSLPVQTDAEKAALRVQRVAYDVTLEAPPVRVTGTVQLLPGTAPSGLLDRSGDMFVPVVGGVAFVGDRQITDPGVDAVLVNRFYLRDVRTRDNRAGTERKPEAAVGGTAAPDRPR